MEVTINKIKDMIDMMPSNTVIYQVVDKSLKRLYYSSGIAELSGYTAEEFKNLSDDNAFNLVHFSDRNVLFKKLSECMKNKEDVNFSYRLIKKDGEIMWVCANGHFMGELDGCPVIVVYIFDLTQDKHNEAMLLDATDLSTIVIDDATKEVLYANKSFYDFTNMDEASVIGSHCYEVLCLTGIYDEDNCICYKAISNKGGIIYHDCEKNKYIRIKAQRLIWCEHNAVAFFVDDVTIEKNADNEIAQRNKRIQELQESTIRSYQNHLDTVMRLNPDAVSTFQMNLTKNICSGGVCQYDNLLALQESGTVDGYFKTAMKYIPSEEHSHIINAMSRKLLLKAFEKGQISVSRKCHYMITEQDEKLIQTVIYMVKNPITNDIEGIIFTLDISQRELNQNIVNHLFNKEYEGAATIDLKRNKYTLLEFQHNRSIVEKSKNLDYNLGVKTLVKKYICEDEQEEYIKNASISEIRKGLEKEETYSFISNYRTKDGGKKLKRITYYYLDEYRNLTLSVTEDITEITKKEHERVETLKSALFAAEKATEQRNIFFSNMSHDMRTPLNGILGFADLAKSSESIKEKNECIDKILVSGDLLLQLINDTLDLSKMESGAMKLYPKPHNAQKVIDDVVTSVEETANKKGITLNVKTDIVTDKSINIDKLRIQQLLINIIGNAIKFTPKGGKVDFFVEHFDQPVDGKNCKIIIEDNGIGMSEEFIPNAFNAFSQQENTKSESTMGTGLGLSIVKQIVDLMNGTIKLTSKENVGTRFEIYLPISYTDVNDNVDAKSSQPIERLSGKHILLCEDHPINRELATRILKKQNIKVTSAENGEIGVEIFKNSKEFSFDAILMDVRMPVIDGLEATKQIRELKRKDAQTIPIIAMTANAFMSEKEETIAVGMNAHLSKPINPTLLFNTLLRYTV